VRRGRQRDYDPCAEQYPGRSTSRGRAARANRGDASEVVTVDKRFRPELTIKRILQLADAFHARTGDWPTPRNGSLPEDRELTWRRVENTHWERKTLKGRPRRPHSWAGSVMHSRGRDGLNPFRPGSCCNALPFINGGTNAMTSTKRCACGRWP
jgi:hypothetical protein